MGNIKEQRCFPGYPPITSVRQTQAFMNHRSPKQKIHWLAFPGRHQLNSRQPPHLPHRVRVALI